MFGKNLLVFSKIGARDGDKLVEYKYVCIYSKHMKRRCRVLKKLILLFVCAYAFFFLSQKDMLPSIGQIKGFLNYPGFTLKGAEK